MSDGRADHRDFKLIIWSSVPFIVVLLTLTQPLLLDIGYSQLHLEFWFVGLAGIALGGFLGALAMWLPWLGQIIFALLCYMFGDLYFIESSYLAYALMVVLLILCFSPVRQKFTIFATVYGLIFLVTSLLITPLLSAGTNVISFSSYDKKLQLPQSAERSDLPPIVHLVLDELGSPLLLADSPEGRRLGEKLQGDYVARGFAVFPRTRSSSGGTVFSLSDLFVGRAGQTKKAEVDAKKNTRGFAYEISKNLYFDRLRSLGYQIEVLQSSYLDFCSDVVADCRTYDHTSRRLLLHLRNTNAVDRIGNALSAMHSWAYLSGTREVLLYRLTLEVIRRNIGLSANFDDAGAQLNVLEAFGELANSFEKPKRGRLYFAHLLLPHFPWVLDRNCQLRPRAQWRYPLHKGGSDAGSSYKAYFEQMRCTHSRITQLVDILTKSLGRDAIIVVHGDHGIRMHKVVPRLGGSKEPEKTLSDSLDSLFLMRAPGLAPGVRDQKAILPERFWRLLGDEIAIGREPAK